MSAYQQVRIKTLGETPEGAALFRIFTPPLSKHNGDTEFLMCPICNTTAGIAVKVSVFTTMNNFPLYCRRCKQHFTTDYRDGIQYSVPETE